jgi:hypothetical protein
LWSAANSEGSQWYTTSTIKFTEGLTAVDMITEGDAGQNLLAVGTESGAIEVYRVITGNEMTTQRVGAFDSA